MTVSTTTNKSRTTGNGVTTAFPASIKIFDETDITVTTIDNTTDALVNTLILNDGGALGYTVVFDTEAETLTVTVNTAPTSGEDLQILRSLPQTQTTDFPRATKFPALSNENALDKVTLIVQDQQEQIDRAFILPEESSVSNPSLPVPSSRRALVWDPAEDGTIINSTNDPDEQAAAAAASASAAAASASSAATSASNAATSASNAATSEANAAQSASDAQAAVGGVLVSADDTTADNLETKLLVGDGLSLSTQNPGANETRTVDIDINGLTDTVITASDEIIFGDVDDSNNRKKDTVQGIIDAGQLERESWAAKAWVNISGIGTVSIRDSYNVTSITDNGTGDYTVNFTNNMSTTEDYCVVISVDDGGSASPVICNIASDASAGNPLAAGSVRVTSERATDGVNIDADFLMVSVFGGLA